MKKMLLTIATAALGSAAMPAIAGPVTLDFEGLQNGEAINGFYNGGTGSLGSSGANYNVQFGPNALALIDSDAGGGGNFANEPTPSTIMFFTTGSAVLNYAQGFTTGFSFYYTTVAFDGVVNVYDDLNAAGNLLGSINLLALGVGTGDPTGDFGNWVVGSLNFSGTAKSVDFGGTVNQVGYDNITFGSTNPNAVPEPSTLVLAGLAFSGLLGLRRRKVY